MIEKVLATVKSGVPERTRTKRQLHSSGERWGLPQAPLQCLSDPLDVQQIAVTDVVRGGGAAQGATAEHDRRSLIVIVGSDLYFLCHL